MRRVALVSVIVLGIFDIVHAQQPPTRAARTTAARQTATANALPIQRIVLYKNGVGYFEHIGRVRGNESIALDFSSAQLDDALTSLTALDLGDGRVTAISYNSDAPLGQRLADLRLPIADHASVSQLLDALRGERVDVRDGGRAIVGRLLGVERHEVVSGSSRVSRDQLTVVTDEGEIRTVDLTPAVSVKLAERDSVQQVRSYLGVLASARAPNRRRMTIATAGTGERNLLVSYVSEVPIWKTTYRIVIPSEGGDPILQGWAVVDNTTGQDWTNVDLSLVAGTPQSFIQQISQPRYGRRPVVQTGGTALPTPQTHDPTLAVGRARIRGAVRDQSSSALPGVTVRLLDMDGRTIRQTVTDAAGSYAIPDVVAGAYRMQFVLPGFATVTSEINALDGDAVQNATMRVAAAQESTTVAGASPAFAGKAGAVTAGVGGGIVGGLASAPPVDRAVVAAKLQEGEAAAAPRALTDLFEYHLTSPVSIPRNQSALVPIVNIRTPLERVSIWNSRTGPQPLRALWLTNTSGLSLDGGTFTVIDDGAFAGEGLIEAVNAGESRLLSYAVDLGVHVESRQRDDLRAITRVVIQRGVIVEHREQRARRVYTIRNNDTTDRAVVIEHPTRAGWTLAPDLRPAETTASAYRFRVAVPAKQTTSFTVEERQPGETQYEIGLLTDDRLKVLVRDTGGNDAVRQALEPIVALKASIAGLSAQLADRAGEIQMISEDEARVRENLRALKDTAEGRRMVRQYAAQLDSSETRIAVLRRERADLDRTFQESQAELARLIAQLSVTIDVD